MNLAHWLGMDWSRFIRARACFAALSLVGLGAASACDPDGSSSLSKTDEDEGAIPDVPPPPENGPKLGSIANATPIFERATSRGRTIGYLHAGALVARGTEPVRKAKDCELGYYAIFPRGYVCLSQGATLDLAHPTLAAMSIQPAFDQPLPYTLGRARTETPLLERDPGREDAVREVQKLAKGSGLAVVGSWSARIGGSEPQRLGLLTNGRFVRAEDLEAARPSEFTGYPIADDKPLPVAFVVKRGVRNYKPDGDGFTKGDLLDYHAIVPLSGRFRTLGGVKFWAAADGELWLRDRDVTTVHRRTKFPDFVQDGLRWIDVGVTLGTLVLYEGTRPLFATLVSTGHDRLENPALGDAPQAVTKLGVFDVVKKHVTLLSASADRPGERYSLFDVPWALELSSGQYLYGAYWHDRFGIEHGPGDVMLSPADAQRVFAWATPGLPKGWHASAQNGPKTVVYVRK